MSYNGWILKVGDYTIDTKKYVKANDYSAYRNIQDLDPYRDANGVLHRNALEHVALKVEFSTPNGLTNYEYAEFMRNIRRNYINEQERKVLATVYVPELDDYVTQEMYFPDPKPTIYGNYNGYITYNSIKVSLIGY